MITRRRLLALCVAAACLAIGASAGPAQAAAPAWNPIAISGPTNLPPSQNEVQQVAVDAEGGTYTLSFSGQTTAAIAFDADATEVEAKLNALSTIGGAGGSVTVVGGPGNNGGEAPYSVTFGGSLGGINQSEMTANGSALTGGQTHSARVTTSLNGGKGTGTIEFALQNIGGFSSSGTYTVVFTLPPNVKTQGAVSGGGWTCTPNIAGQSTESCSRSEVVGPGLATAFDIPIEAQSGAVSGPIQMSVSGGGAAEASSETQLTVSATPAEPGFQVFTAGTYDSNGNLDTRAGAHPYSASTAIFVTTKRYPTGEILPVGDPKNIEVALPPGFIADPIAVPSCSEEETFCSPQTGVGTTQIPTQTFGKEGTAVLVHNIEAPYGYPGKVEFTAGNIVSINVVGNLRSDEDYGLEFGSYNTPQILSVFGSFFTFWGAPGDVSHDGQRCTIISPVSGCQSAKQNIAFITNPVNCAEEQTSPPTPTLTFNTWQFPDQKTSKGIPLPPVTECNKLHFSANFTFEPSNTKSDSTASFRTELAVPSEGLTSAEPEARTTPEIKDTVVKLPEGVTLNASGADGLQACSEEQIGYRGNEFPMPNPIRFNRNPNQCPEASKIGTGELKTALLEEPLHGALYLAAQGKGNPFGSLFAIYLVIEDPRHGIFIKLPGEVEANKQTGQLEVIFHNLPQVPFTYLRLSLKGGNRSALASPTTCGNYVTTATNTPWSYPESGPPTESANGFEINEGPEGGACAKTPQERPFDLGWNAGAEKTEAGVSGPFDFQITRPDGSQELETLELGTPQGVSASLKGIPYCTEAEIKAAEQSTGKQEQEHPACPAASQVGTAETGAGSGPTPFYVSGKLYLAGPYKGAPISVVAITPAVAGPFDLGNVVVRSAVFINRETAQVQAKTDPIPQLLEGVSLRIRDVRIHLDRSDWTINPTSCEASSVKLTAHGNSGAVVEKSARFQVGNCSSLGFKPKLTGKVTGPTKRGGLPAFTATLTYPEGHYANLKDVQVALPHSEFLEQAHINTVCTRVQAAAHECPQGSIYGYAEAFTPLLDKPLTGPVFLKSSVHKLPDLAIALKGPEDQPVEVEFAGRIDSIHGQIRDTIEGLPDVPVSKFILRMKGGKKGLLVNSRDICNGAQTKMTVHMTAQNNAVSDTRPPLGNSCGAKKHKAKKHSKRSHKRALLGDLVRAW